MRRLLLFWTLMGWMPIASNALGNMRRCLLLPIDYENSEQRFSLFQELEKYLEEGDWCHYRSNSPVLGILSSYQKNLHQHLEREDVLKVIAEKTKSGSLIRIRIKKDGPKVTISLKVMADNGRDIYFQKASALNSDKSFIIVQEIKNQLEQYRQKIPYDGIVEGVLGDRFTVDFGSEKGLHQGDEILLSRGGGKNRHPLLKEIVSYQQIPIGRGKIFHVSKTRGHGKVEKYQSRKKLKVGDWAKKVVLKAKEKKREAPKYSTGKQYSYGRLGEWGLNVDLGNLKEEGTFIGAGLKGVLWITRKYWVGGEWRHKSVNNGMVLKLKGGVKYLPLGFFYGPFVDFFMGYAVYKYDLEKSKAGAFSVSGLLLGAKGAIPLKKMLATYLEIGFIFSPTYTREEGDLGSTSSTSNYYFEWGISYAMAPRISFFGGYHFMQNRADFKHSPISIKASETSLKAGTTFTF